MANDVQIRQVEFADRHALLSFLRKAYPDEPRKSDLDFWTWQFRENPNRPSDNVPVWIATSGARIVGQLATVPVELNVAAETVPSVWILDLIVDREFRRLGIAKRLVLEIEKHYPFMLGVATNAQHSPSMLKGLGWGIFREIPRFHKLLFPGNALGGASNVKPLRSIVDLAFSPFRPGVKSSVGDMGAVRFVDDFDSSFDDLWEEARGQWTCSTVRTSAMLDWQFRTQPGKKYDVLGFYDNDKLLGYAVLFFRKPNADGLIAKAAISDICYHPSKAKETVDALLQAAIELALERRAGGIVTDVIDPVVEQRLRKFGFRKVKSGLILMASAPRSKDIFYDADSWFLTRCDSDISIFEDANL